MSHINYVNISCGQLWTESFGDASNPLVILISGESKQGIYWHESLCHALADHVYCVVRFDNRDTGLSTHINFNSSQYHLNDMADDVLLIIKAYNKEKAHLVGSGMGGYIAQILSTRGSDVIESMVLLMSTTNPSPIEKPHQVDVLPGTFPETIKKFQQVGRISDNDPNWLDKTMLMLKILNGEDAPFNETKWLLLAEQLKSRLPTREPKAFFHHHILAKSLSNLNFDTTKIKMPALIVHGESDPIIPVEHAFASHQAITNSKLEIIKNMGHLLSSNFHDNFINAVVPFWNSSKIKTRFTRC
jgi:pimeloyl-ACP methyl ester carboxylesterase